MKTILIRLVVIFVICCTPAFLVHAQQTEAPLTNAAVVKLVRAGFKEKTVIAIIHNRPAHFSLDPDKLIELKRNGVSENIILAMLAQSSSFVFADDDWTDSELGRTDRSAAGGNPKTQSNSSDIFGSNSGSRSQNNGRGLSGGNEGETTTTGSATVRILRPPTEAGDSQLKLEKSPTLTNDAVIKLVEAGFSEGTIIKRIEDSPADFDLSPTKLEELRRRRVSDAIIVAMTAAMGDDVDRQQTAPNANRNRSKGN